MNAWAGSLLALLTTVGLGADARASTLLLVADATGETAQGWWAADAPAPTGAFDEALLHEIRAGGMAAVDPFAEGAPPVSRIFRQVEISDNNARSLAGVFGCDGVLVGRVERASAGTVPWLERPRERWTLSARWLRADGTGVPMDVEVEATVDSGEAADQVAAEVLAQRLAVRLPRTRQGEAGAVPELETVVVAAPASGTAVPYVAFRGYLREGTAGVVGVEERWATEGRVGLAIARDAGTEWAEIGTSIESLEGVSLTGVSIGHVERVDAAIIVEIAEPAPRSIEPQPTSAP